MFPPFQEEDAFKYCRKIKALLDKKQIRIKQLASLSEERKDNGLMIGLCVACADSSVKILLCCSGISKDLEIDNDSKIKSELGLSANDEVIIVSPIVNPSLIENALCENDKEIHLLTDKINSFEEDTKSLEEKKVLTKKRNDLCLESQKKVFDLYKFHSFQNKIISLKAACALYNKNKLPPTGTGECCAPKLLDYACKNNLNVKSMCEFFYESTYCTNSLQTKETPECTVTSIETTERSEASVPLNPNQIFTIPPCNSRCSIVLPAILGLRIIYRDDYIIVVNKQSGLLSVPGRGIDKQDCIVNRIKKLYPFCIEQPAVHRLDMETSGLMVLAFTKEAHKELNRQFENGEVEKKYIALIDGVLAKKKIANEGTMELYFRLDIDNRPHQIWDEINGKKAVTQWKIMDTENYISPSNNNRAVTRVLFTPHTGRTHQLRLASSDSHGFGLPIIGDSLYGKCEEGERLMLHAAYLSFTHPVTKHRMTFNSECEF